MKTKVMFALVVLLACMSATADNIYVESKGTTLYVVDSNTGASTLIGPYGKVGVLSQAFSPSGTLYAVSRGGSAALAQLLTVDLNTGAATVIGNTGVQVEALAFTPDGTLYAANFNTNDLYTLDLSTGAATFVGHLGFSGIMDMAWDPANSTMYAVASLCNGSQLYSINLASGAGTWVTDLDNTCLMTLAIDSSNRLLTTDFSDPNSPLYQIDRNTGSLTSLGFTGLVSTMGAAAKPEPSAEIQTLETMVSNLNLGFGTTTSLNKKLAAALDLIQAGDTASACAALQDFMSEVSAQSGKKISTSDASALTNYAAAIRTLLGC
jgi:Tol biopolymer transport system component